MSLPPNHSERDMAGRELFPPDAPSVTTTLRTFWGTQTCEIMTDRRVVLYQNK